MTTEEEVVPKRAVRKKGLRSGIPFRRVPKGTLDKIGVQRGFVRDTSAFEVMGWYRTTKRPPKTEPELYAKDDTKQVWFDPKPYGGRGYTLIGVGRRLPEKHDLDRPLYRNTTGLGFTTCPNAVKEEVTKRMRTADITPDDLWLE